jgi:dTDP-4-amino-4,6-dideoxygalactose transaminase
MNVPFVDLTRQHAPIAAELRDAFDRVVGANGFILGEEVAGFEGEFAAYCDSEHCVGVASGTAALTLMMLAAGIGPGDEVVVPAHTFIASALGVIHAGAKPVFCDVEAGTGLIDPAAADAAIGPRTAAILAVHLYGQVCDMDALAKVADRHGLALFEDAAQAHGATFRGARAGSLGRAAAFSFYPSKNLGALGDGGAVVTGDRELADNVRRLRHLGQLGKGDHDLPGFNERLDGLQAAMLRVKLPHLDNWNATRRERAGTYAEALEGWHLLEERPESPCIFHLYPVRVPDRERVAAELAARGVATGVHYSPSVPAQPPFAAAGPPEQFPESLAWARDELSLPMFDALKEEEVLHVAEVCRGVPAAR